MFCELRVIMSIGSVTKVRIEFCLFGAEVYLGDVFKGYMLLMLEGLKYGTQFICIKKDGYFSHGWLVDFSLAMFLILSHKLRLLLGRARVIGWVKIL